VRAATLAAADALVSAREEDGDATRTGLHERRVAGVHVLGAGLLLLVVTVADAVHQRRVRHAADLVGPLQQRELPVVDDGQRDLRGHGLDVLDVKLGLDAARGLLIADGLGNRHIPVTALAEAVKVGLFPELALELCNGHGVARVGLVCFGQGLVWQLVALRNDRGSHEVCAAPRVARVGPLHRRTDTDHLLRDQPGELQQLADHAHVLSDLGRQVVGSTSTHNLRPGVLAVLELMQLHVHSCLGADNGNRHREHVPVRGGLHLPGSGSLEVCCGLGSTHGRHSKQLGDLLLTEMLAVALVVRIRNF